MRYLIVILLIVGCSKITVQPDSSVPHPYIKQHHDSHVLNFEVRFDSTCLYEPMRAECDGDWSKLIYFGTFNPHDKAAAFVWRHYNDRLEIGHYLWYDGEPPYIWGRMGVIQAVTVDTWYNLTIDLTDGVKWLVNDSTVKQYEQYPIDATWITGGWYGGADNDGNDCHAMNKITYQIHIK